MVNLKFWTWFKKEEKKDEYVDNIPNVPIENVQENKESVVPNVATDTMSKEILFRNTLVSIEKRLDSAETMVEWGNIKNDFLKLNEENKGLISENSSLKELADGFEKKFTDASRRINVAMRMNN